MIKFTKENVILLHSILSQKAGSAAGVREIGLLESAIESAYQTFDGQELYPTTEEKGARMCFSLISNHAFVDGNKRIGVLALMTFLELNGAKISPTNEEIIRMGLGLAEGKVGYEELLLWVRENRI